MQISSTVALTLLTHEITRSCRIKTSLYYFYSITVINGVITVMITVELPSQTNSQNVKKNTKIVNYLQQISLDRTPSVKQTSILGLKPLPLKGRMDVRTDGRTYVRTY